MNMSRQIKTTKKEALAFVRYLEFCGYDAHNVTRDGITDIHFTKDGIVTVEYGVTIIKGAGSWIMVRAS
jgi:hypothetical protein